MNFVTDHIHLKAKDAVLTSQWYIRHFGATITEQVDWPNMLTIRLDLGGTRINVSEHKDDNPKTGTSEIQLGLEHFGIKTDNLNAIWSSLQQTKECILSPIRTLPNQTRIFFVEGPDNVRIELLEYFD